MKDIRNMTQILDLENMKELLRCGCEEAVYVGKTRTQREKETSEERGRKGDGEFMKHCV